MEFFKGLILGIFLGEVILILVLMLVYGGTKK